MMKFQKQGIVRRTVYFANNRLQESKDFTKKKKPARGGLADF
jgi:hypothetical protein